MNWSTKIRNNVEWQHDLSTTLEKMGDILYEQGKLDSALGRYRESFNIREKLARQDRENATLQLKLSFSYADIGDILTAQGEAARAESKLATAESKWSDALQNYDSALEIRQELANQDPNAFDRQRYMSNCLLQIGHVLQARGEPKDLEKGLADYRKSLAINKALFIKDPKNAMWKRDYSISLEREGDVLKAQGKCAEALSSYQHSLSLRQELLSVDGANSMWQSDVSWSYLEIGDALSDQKDFQQALENYQKSLKIAERLTKSDPTNDEWQTNLALIQSRLQKVKAAVSNP